TDQIFLLSIPEMEQYEDYCLGSPHTSCEPTKYAKAQGAKSVWWLRTPGVYPSFAVYVAGVNIYMPGNSVTNKEGVRPAMWVYLN
ncbi:MAG: DUF6273 domain-containing protein, partial [Lachnospiraceae bacterium]|nr:DUF6273 domain-containing protein [Lachnospiraceae bacterium]